MSAADDVQAKTESANRKKKARRERDSTIRKRVVSALMSAPDGRRYIWLELEAAGVFAQSYCPDSFDRTAFTEGKRSAGNRLLAEVQRFAVADFVRMLQENNAQVEEIQDVRTTDSDA